MQAKQFRVNPPVLGAELVSLGRISPETPEALRFKNHLHDAPCQVRPDARWWPMLSEDLPPLAPFPEVSPPPPDAGGTAAAEPSLLSSEQRREFTLAADLLSGRPAPSPESRPVSAADDFLPDLPSDRDEPGDFTLSGMIAAEEPVQKLDFLDLAGPAPAQNAPLADTFSLQSLAASLAVPAPAPAPAAVPAARRRDDWEPPSIPAFPSLAGAVSSPAEAKTTTTVPLTAADEKKDGFYVSLPALESAPPALFPPLSEPEEEEDFDAPLLFPVPSAEGHAHAPSLETTDPHDRALAAILSGALLIVLGLYLACRLPSLALEADAAASSGKATLAGHLRGGMLLSIAGAAVCLLLGIGATTLRRWAPPLIHAAAWTVLLTVLCGMGVATASMFQLSSNTTPGDAVAVDGTAIFVTAGVLGVAVPLMLIAVFQRPGVARLCAQADKRPRWTDSRSIPALMVFSGSLLLAAAAFSMSLAHSAFPAFGNLIAGTGAWAGVGIAALAAAGLAAAAHQASWWLLTALTALLTAGLFLTCRQHGWQEIFSLSPAGVPALADAVIAAGALSPLILIVLMTRRAFAFHQEV